VGTTLHTLKVVGNQYLRLPFATFFSYSPISQAGERPPRLDLYAATWCNLRQCSSGFMDVNVCPRWSEKMSAKGNAHESFSRYIAHSFALPLVELMSHRTLHYIYHKLW